MNSRMKNAESGMASNFKNRRGQRKVPFLSLFPYDTNNVDHPKNLFARIVVGLIDTCITAWNSRHHLNEISNLLCGTSNLNIWMAMLLNI